MLLRILKMFLDRYNTGKDALDVKGRFGFWMVWGKW